MSRTPTKTSLAVSAALAGTSGNIAQAQIEEIIATAAKRAESAQDVPISVQAATGGDLREPRVETLDRYAEYLPNAVGAGNGPGRNELHIRRSATEQSGITAALYVDEQPVSFGCRYGIGGFGAVRIPDGAGGRRLPADSRILNPAVTTLSAALGMERGTWGAELHFDNLNNESAPVMRIAGRYTPAITVQRPRTIGLRLSCDFD